MAKLRKTGTEKLVEVGARRLRFPFLFAVTAIVFVADLVIPDAIPFIDEVFLALLTVLMGSWKHRREEKTRGTPPPSTKDEA